MFKEITFIIRLKYKATAHWVFEWLLTFFAWALLSPSHLSHLSQFYTADKSWQAMKNGTKMAVIHTGEHTGTRCVVPVYVNRCGKKFGWWESRWMSSHDDWLLNGALDDSTSVSYPLHHPQMYRLACFQCQSLNHPCICHYFSPNLCLGCCCCSLFFMFLCPSHQKS